MSRTGEVVLSIIGALIYGFFALMGATMVWFFNNEALWNDASQEIQQQQPELAQADMETVLSFFQGGGWFLIVLSLIAVVLGILSIVFMTGDKKPKAAGIILIVVAAVSTLATFGGLIFGGLFYLIAGIMCLVRKAPAPATHETVE
ncbi:DUF4064 domain-containing protein [Lentibacillus amyloliquefaciens]|uniref:DUF4064 domain-containing protein n=1 Tax=Lentibacillus amyloliquefaciens TaxID=1472767 RepID=A0A0U4E8W6_9BACI|nr:DUF4064 domain-containing protein [Lentibacillus amyloliquefaciens]ALX49281.1 hypothetical protein AOX59_12195 [Lentibacillus amyloliquefaciens]